MTARLKRPRIEAEAWYWSDPEPSRTACKHGRADCDRCGTIGATDALHRTRGGRGAVARLRGNQ